MNKPAFHPQRTPTSLDNRTSTIASARWKQCLCLALSAAIALWFTGTTRGADYYRVVLLGNLLPPRGATNFRDYHVNNSGQVVGVISVNGSYRAAYWRNGSIVDLGWWGGSSNYSNGADINNAGLVAGQVNDNFGHNLAAVRLPSGWGSLLYPNSYNYTTANAVSDAGRVVGYATTGAFGGLGGQAFYHPGYDGNTKPSILITPSGYSAADAYGVNDSVTIVGEAYTSGNANSTAVKWDSTGVSLLGPAYGTSNYQPSGANSVNDGNVIVGYFGGNAAVWINSVLKLVGVQGVANAITNTNCMVGNTILGPLSNNSLAWFYSPTDTRIFNLTALQDNANLKLYTASDIAETLVIVGQSNQGGYCAVPVLYRSVAGAWDLPSAWLWQLQPSAVHPVVLASANPITITGPANPATMAELTIGGPANGSNAAVSLALAANQALSVTGNLWGNGRARVAATGTLTVDGQVNAPLLVEGCLTGKGKVNGDLTVETGGVVSVEGTGGLKLTGGIVVNRGTMRFSKGATLDASGVSSFSNEGVLDLVTGSAQLPAGFSNGPTGVVFTAANSAKVKSLAKVDATVTVQIDGLTGHSYQLQRASSPEESAYANLGDPQAGTTGATLSFVDSSASGTQGFYRIKIDP